METNTTKAVQPSQAVSSPSSLIHDALAGSKTLATNNYLPEPSATQTSAGGCSSQCQKQFSNENADGAITTTQDLTLSSNAMDTGDKFKVTESTMHLLPC